jgi:WD40 repeat protein
MATRWGIVAWVCLAVWANAEAAGPAGGDAPPVLRLEPLGSSARITALAFSHDGRTLYAAGFDKVVRPWKLVEGRFVADPQNPGFRVPIGPGREGLINAMAVSPDDRWIAVGGMAVMSLGARFDQPGFIVDAEDLPDSAWEDKGVITLLNTRPGAEPAVRQLRGHRGEVLALAFAPAEPDQPTRLISVARERTGRGEFTGKIRLWDVDRAARLADYPQPLKVRDNRPGLAVWPGEKGLRIGIAWGDGRFRLWNPSEGEEGSVAEEVCGSVNGNMTVAYYPGADQILTGAWGRNANADGGQVRRWDVAPLNAAGVRAVKRPEGVGYLLPVAITPVASQADGNPDLAAAIFQAPGENPGELAYWLGLIDPGSLRAASPYVFLWASKGEPVVPTIAAAPHGSYLAVAGNKGHEIFVYRVSGLRSGNAEPERQRLRGIGTTIRSVAFVTKGRPGRPGLLLGKKAESLPDGLVFDLDRRTLTPDAKGQGWKLAGPAGAGWQVTPSFDAEVGGRVRCRFAWTGPVNNAGEHAVGNTRIDLEPGEDVSDYVLLPPVRAKDAPLLAIASWNKSLNEPLLRLFQAKSGTLLRQLVGHSDRITSLAGSADGKLLASAGQDQTVCLWGLSDVDEVADRHGVLRGLVLKPGDGDGAAVVVRVPMKNTEKGLAIGDVIRGMTGDGHEGKLIALSSPEKFYAAIWDMEPGKRVKLTVERAGGPRQVEAVVEQGVDDRKPLAFLFITEDRTDREWIAWAPSGPYDRSSANAERYLGWHFNPEKAGQPVRFAPAGEYRNQFYRQGLLGRLTAQAKLDLGEPEKLPRPELAAVVYEGDDATPREPDAQGQMLVRGRKVAVDLTVAGPSLEQNQVDSLTGRVFRTLADGKLQPIKDLPDLDPQSALGQTVSTIVELPAEQGIYKVQFGVRTRETNPQTAQREVTLRFQPPPPRIDFDADWLKKEGFGKRPPDQTVVRQKSFTIQAQVRPGAPGQAFDVHLSHNGKEISPDAKVDGDLQVPIVLEPGQNTVEIVAVNRGALAGFTPLETEKQTLSIFYRVEGPLNLIVREVLVSDQRVPVDPRKPLVVVAPRIRVRGEIRADADLADAGWEKLQSKPPRAKQLADFRPGAAQEVAINEELILDPGLQTFRFRAKTAGQSREQLLTVDYRPPVPELVAVTAPAEIIAGRDEPEIELAGEVIRTKPEYPFEMLVQLNGSDLAARAIDLDKLPAETKALLSLGKVRVRPGDNRIQVRLRNAWGIGPARIVMVAYRVPPRILSLRDKSEKGKPVVELVAEVASRFDPPLTRVMLNGRAVPPARFELRKLTNGPDGPTWELVLKETPLQKGENSFSLVVANPDGECRQPATQMIAFRPAEPPPEVAILGARDLPAMKDPSYLMTFRVRSTTSLSRIEVFVANGRPGAEKPLVSVKEKDLGRSPSKDLIEVVQTVLVPLEPGMNHLGVEAVNEGGKKEDQRDISYVPRPVRLLVNSAALNLAQPAPDAALKVQGYVTWTEELPDYQVQARLKRLEAYVNGFRQRPLHLEPREGPKRERAFSAEIVLNHQRGNQVDIVCPGLPGATHHFTIDCAKKPPRPALHLLVVGMGMDDVPLEQRAYKALGITADAKDPGKLRSGPFEPVVLHPLKAPGYVRKNRVMQAVKELSRSATSPNDVVIVYWLGKEGVNERGEVCLLTDEALPNQPLTTSTTVSLAELLGACQGMRGAQVLFFDVAQGNPLALNIPFTQAAVLRQAWLNKVPAPTLLEALEEKHVGAPMTLKDVVRAANDLRARYGGALSLKDNLKDLPYLATLVLTQEEP